MKRPSENSCRSLADLRRGHRAAGERDGDAGAELDALGVLGGEQQARNGSWLVSAVHDAVVAGRLRVLGGACRVARIEADSSVDLHAVDPSLRT